MAEFFCFFLDTKEFKPLFRDSAKSSKWHNFYNVILFPPLQSTCRRDQRFASLPKNYCFLLHQFDLCETGFLIHIDPFCFIFHSNLIFTNITKTGYLIINFLSHCVWIRPNMMDKVSPSRTYWFVIIKVVSLYEHRFTWTLKQSLIISSL